MAYYLAKTDPDTYTLADLERDGRTVWDGVTNAQAVRVILAMKTGDRVLIYHSGGESSIVGLADIVGDGRPDPKNAKSAVADFKFAGRLDTPVTLSEVKQAKLFEDFALVRQSRLSTMAVPDAFVKWMRKKNPNAGI